jgi:two-component system nitrogen regulation sensor histidine kinase GlnL
MQALTEAGTESPRITMKTRAVRRVTLGTEQHRLVCKVDIIDNGPGIPKELLDSVFYPMVTGRAEGSGLGLSIAQSVINQHQGLIEVTSIPGETNFQILIPLEL